MQPRSPQKQQTRNTEQPTQEQIMSKIKLLIHAGYPKAAVFFRTGMEYLHTGRINIGIFLLKQAATSAQGHKIAAYTLGVQYYQGYDSITSNKPNYVRALWWFTLAAEQKLPEAQYMAVIMLYTGQGTKQNHQQAKHYFKLAAKQGLALAQYRLGVMWHTGQGGSKNVAKAKHYYQLAAGQGLDAAKQKLAVMENTALSQQNAEDSLTPSQEFNKLVATKYTSFTMWTPPPDYRVMPSATRAPIRLVNLS